MKKNKKKYELGSYVKPLGKTGQGFAMGANLLGSAIGGDGGNFISGVASGAMTGGPLGAVLGGIGSVIGSIGQQKRLAKQKALEQQAFSQDYQANLLGTADTSNDNPYGQVFANGGNVPDPNLLAKLQRNSKYQPQGKTVKGKKPIQGEHFELFDEMLDAPQKAATWALTGNYQKPSQAFNIQNKWGATAIDTVLDPMNVLFFLKGTKTAKALAEAQKADALLGAAKYAPRAAGNKVMNKILPTALDVDEVTEGLTRYANGGMIDPTTIGYGAFNQKTPIGTTTRKQMTPQELEYITKKTGMKDTQFKDNLPVVEKYLTQFRSGIEPVGSPPVDMNNAFTMNPDGTRNAGVYNHKMGMFNFAKYAMGGDIQSNLINIEKGELQIDPATGKILREYTGMNPETGGLYSPHSKGKDTKNNIVTAEPGTFIITKAKAKEYKDSVVNNDKLHQNTILQNIKNYKEDKQPNSKMALGGYTDPWNQISQNNQLIMRGLTPGVLQGSPITAGTGVNLAGINPTISSSGVPATSYGTTQDQSLLGKIGEGIGTYGNALYNIGQGMFGKVDKVNQVQATRNPYKQDILANMPQDINFEPIRQQLLRREQGMFNQIDNSTSASPVARANKQNLFANTQGQLGQLLMQNQINNNGVRSQRAGIYSNLGNQEMNATDRAQQINLGIDEQNRANQGAKQNLLSTGLTQLQQAYQNNRTNNSKAAMDKYKVELLRQMFPNLKYYGSQFGDDALKNLIG